MVLSGIAHHDPRPERTSRLKVYLRVVEKVHGGGEALGVAERDRASKSSGDSEAECASLSGLGLDPDASMI